MHRHHIVTVFTLTAWLSAQVAADRSATQPVHLIRGPFDNPHSAPALMDRFIVSAADTTTGWLRIRFDPTGTNLGAGSWLRIVSFADGHAQDLDAATLRDWSHHSAYFNGSAVAVEVHVGAGARGCRVHVASLRGSAPYPQSGEETICGTDNRQPWPYRNNSIGRLEVPGAGISTAFVTAIPFVDGSATGGSWSGRNSFLVLSAGHSFAGGNAAGAVVVFDPPTSFSNCTRQYPSPANQFAVDANSVVAAVGGVGDDYAAFRLHPNPADPNPGVCWLEHLDLGLVQVHTAGFGVDGSAYVNGPGTSCTCSATSGQGAWNHTRQSSAVGSLLSPTAGSHAAALAHNLDTCPGDSGAPIFHVENNQSYDVVGIHTHGGCTATGGQNSGTKILANTGLRAAIAAACAPNDDCATAARMTPAAVGWVGAAAVPYWATPSSQASTPAPPWSVGVNPHANDVWYVFTAAMSVPHTFWLLRNGQDRAIEVFDGGCGGLTLIGASSTVIPTPTTGPRQQRNPNVDGDPFLTLDLVSGSTYFLRVTAVGGVAYGLHHPTVTSGSPFFGFGPSAWFSCGPEAVDLETLPPFDPFVGGSVALRANYTGTATGFAGIGISLTSPGTLYCGCRLATDILTIGPDYTLRVPAAGSLIGTRVRAQAFYVSLFGVGGCPLGVDLSTNGWLDLVVG
ncbi:MAG: hypothetical protein IPK26_20835 [Planctomycetes bacterium]|nr:hypothetical protein [Planctomycetota bacterium]